MAPTSADARDVLVEGESGILAVSPSWDRPEYEPSKRRLTWKNGAIATLFSADEPDRLRGPQHDAAWCDELAAWRYPEAWDMLLMGLRLGCDPKACITTTPRPIPLIRSLLADPHTKVTRGSTYENRANLAQAFLDAILTKYEGTRLGRQELEAEILDDVPGALWNRTLLEKLRVRTAPTQFKRVVVSIDPATSNNPGSNETGIVVVGAAECNCKGRPEVHGFILDDLSGNLSPDAWGRAAVGAYKIQKADRVVAEINNGGNLVEANLRTVDRTIPYKGVHASQGKRTRAEPIAALFEQGKVHHVGAFPKMEDQLCTWEPLSGDKSPDRLDAMVWGLTELMLQGSEPPKFSLPDNLAPRRI